jgi:hypothetical protein
MSRTFARLRNLLREITAAERGLLDPRTEVKRPAR